MNNLTKFLKQLTINGNAKLLVEIDKTKYMSYAILIHDSGDIIANIAVINYTEPLYDEVGNINPNAKIISVSSLDDPSEEFVYKTIAKVIASNYQSEKGMIKSDNLKFDYSAFSFNYFYEIAYRMMMISNHDLICSNCVGEHKYLDKYLNNTCSYLESEDKRYTLEEIELMEKELTDRVIAIDIMAHGLKTITGNEYLKIAYKWIDLYEDRENQSCKSLCMK